MATCAKTCEKRCCCRCRWQPPMRTYQGSVENLCESIAAVKQWHCERSELCRPEFFSSFTADFMRRLFSSGKLPGSKEEWNPNGNLYKSLYETVLLLLQMQMAATDADAPRQHGESA